MDEEILKSIKKLLSVPDDYTVFDVDIMIHINSAFMVLRQLGVGPALPYSITPDGGEMWEDFLGGDDRLSAVKSYVYIYVRLLFDPPESSFVLESFKRQKDELEWRLNVEAETPT